MIEDITLLFYFVDDFCKECCPRAVKRETDTITSMRHAIQQAVKKNIMVH